MSRKSWPILAALFALLLLASACGDSETTDAAADGDDASDAAMEESTDDGSTDDESMDDMDHEGEHEHGAVLEVPDGMAVPTISVSAEPDSVTGHNLTIDLKNFEVTPENASTDPVDGEGHLHLYIDGQRTLRFYNDALHLKGLEPGDHEVMVEVSANDHSAYAVDGEPIRAMTTITVADADSDNHGTDHGHDDTALFESANSPTVEVAVTDDPKSGWNLQAEVGNFTYAPQSVGSDAVDGEGHLHLYIDGERVTRLYGPWWHIGALDAGMHEITVEVSGNDHSAYGVDGEPLTATVWLEVLEADATPAEHDDHDDDGSQAMEEDAGHDDAEHGDSDSDSEGDGHSHSGSGETIAMAASEADVVITATLAGGDLEIDDRRFKVETGSTVGIIFESDEAEQVHVHGYDLLVDVGPDNPVDLAFLADSPGTFEVEFEKSGRFLFEIQVS